MVRKTWCQTCIVPGRVKAVAILDKCQHNFLADEQQYLPAGWLGALFVTDDTIHDNNTILFRLSELDPLDDAEWFPNRNGAGGGSPWRPIPKRGTLCKKLKTDFQCRYVLTTHLRSCEAALRPLSSEAPRQLCPFTGLWLWALLAKLLPSVRSCWNCSQLLECRMPKCKKQKLI